MADKELVMQVLAGGGVATQPGQLTGAGLVDQVMGFLGRTGTSERARTLQYLNWAQQELARQHNWNCLYVVTTGVLTENVALYNWPAGLRTVLSFKVTGVNAGKLRGVSRRTMDADDPDPTATSGTGTPLSYVWYGNFFQLNPIPDDAYPYELLFQKWPADLVDGVGTSSFVLMDDLLSYLAAMHLSMRLGLLSDCDQYRRMVYFEYPAGSGNKSGLLAQAIASDKNHPDYVVQRREFHLQPLSRPANYLSNPTVMR